MSDKKNGQKKTESVGHPWWVELVASQPGVDLDPTLMEATYGSVPRLVALAIALEAQKPKVPTAAEAESIGGVVEGRKAAEAFLDHRPAAVADDVAGPRAEMSSGIGLATRILAMAAKVKVPAVAAEATTLFDAVFGEGMPVWSMTPEEATIAVDRVEKALADEALAARFEVFVPAAVMAAVFDANQRMKGALGMRGWKEEVLPIDRPMVSALLRRRIRRYVYSVVASVEVEDLATVTRATAALQPIARFREQSARLRARGLTVEAEVESDEGPPPDPLPAGEVTD